MILVIISILVETFGKTKILSSFFRQEICHSLHWIKNETNLNLEWLIVLFDEIRVLVSLRMFIIPDKAFLESFKRKQTFYMRIPIPALPYDRATQPMEQLHIKVILPFHHPLAQVIHWIQFQQLQQRRWERGRRLGYGLLV